MAYWYEKESGALLNFEKECYFKFLKDYNHPDLFIQFSYDNRNRFCVEVEIPFKAAQDMPWRKFLFHIVYEHDHPGRGSDGLFGGSIKVFPLTQLKPGFHHLVFDPTMGIYHICQVRTASSAEVNGYKVLQRVLRWIDVYCVWERTGVDLDA